MVRPSAEVLDSAVSPVSCGVSAVSCFSSCFLGSSSSSSSSSLAWSLTDSGQKNETCYLCVCVRDRRKIELTAWGKKVPISLDGMGPVRIRHSSHDFGWQSSHSVDLAGWQAKMASIEIWIPWRNAHKPHLNLCLWDTRPSFIREQARLASVETNTSETHPPAPSWNTSMHYETLQLPSVGRVCAPALPCVASFYALQAAVQRNRSMATLPECQPDVFFCFL